MNENKISYKWLNIYMAYLIVCAIGSGLTYVYWYSLPYTPGMDILYITGVSSWIVVLSSLFLPYVYLIDRYKSKPAIGFFGFQVIVVAMSLFHIWSSVTYRGNDWGGLGYGIIAFMEMGVALILCIVGLIWIYGAFKEEKKREGSLNA